MLEFLVATELTEEEQKDESSVNEKRLTSHSAPSKGNDSGTTVSVSFYLGPTPSNYLMLVVSFMRGEAQYSSARRVSSAFPVFN